MVFAETSVGLETIAGGGVTAMLIAVMTAVLRRTKEADERNDAFTKVVIATTTEREAKAWAERDDARAELAQVKDELARVRAQLAAAQEQWKEENTQWTKTRPAQRKRPPSR